MKIVIIDGQGGRMGRSVIEQLKTSYPDQELYAIGTNSIATSAMLKAGATYGATGENPAIVNSQDADIIILLHRPDYYDKEDRPGEADIIVAKHRAGATATVTALFQGDMARFVNYTGRPEPGGGE